QPRRIIAAKQITEQLVLPRPDAGQARDRRKQRIEEDGAHACEPRAFRGGDARPRAGRPRLFSFRWRWIGRWASSGIISRISTELACQIARASGNHAAM